MASFSYALGNELNHLTLIGTADIDGTGNNAPNRLTGNSGINVLRGGNGGDSYYIQNVEDVVSDSSGTYDAIYSTVSYSLNGTGVEHITLLGTADINATGSSGNNQLTGNAGVNILTGGLGRDMYFIQNSEDVVVEAAGGDLDEIFSWVSYDMSASTVEKLYLVDSAHINATGNLYNNAIRGNSGNNILDGGAGNDTIEGSGGADIFLFRTGSGADTVTDFNGAANDRIDISAYTLGVVNSSLVVEVGVDVQINLGGGNTILVRNTSFQSVIDHMIW